MRHGSLFSGIGGFDLASEWMGWENVFHCEWNEFGKKVLHHYWPNAESFDDITQTDFTKYANKIDILTGGFPCQPYSSAGQRKGKEDERHLWPQMLRAIQEIKPKYIVGENVFGLLNWNGGMVFDEVHSDLESAGYEVQAVVIPAAAVNAPHGRDRVWFVAYSNSTRLQKERTEQPSTRVKQHGELDGFITNTKFKSEGSDRGTNDETEGNIRRGNEGNVFGTLRGDGITTNPKECGCRGRVCERCADGERKLFSDEQRRSEMGREIEGHSGIGDVANTMRKGLQGGQEINRWGKHDQEGSSVRNEFRTNGTSDDKYPRIEWEKFPTQSPICGGDDGLPTELDRITFSKWRNESIKAYGNAIVPQVAYEIFKAIKMTNGN
jgi:DNA (cytosine-5)-methyltransferase 1